MVHFVEGERWENAIKNQVVTPKRIYYPASLQDIVECVRQAEAGQLRVRAAGSGHSFSNIATTNDYLVYTKAFNKTLPLDATVLKAGVDATALFETEAGITIQDLIDTLATKNRALPNLGSYTGQAIIGAISTSTHGSGMELGPLPAMVRSLVIVATGGKVYRIEPTNGITDPTKYNHPEIELKQDDDWFYSAVVSMGCMGVIYSIVIETLPLYNLLETRTLTTWNEVKKILQQGDELHKNRHFEVLVNAYPRADGEHTCIITRRNVASPDTPLFLSGRYSYWSTFLNSLPAFYSQNSTYTFLSGNPKSIPSTLDNGLAQLKCDRYVNRYDKVLNLGVNGIDGYATELAYPMDTYIQATEEMFLWAQKSLQLSGGAGDIKNYFTSPFSLRFVKAADAYLSPQYGRDTCMMEIPFVCRPGVNLIAQTKATMSAIESRCFKLKGRPHWGLEFDNITAQQVRDIYPKFDTWLTVHNTLNPRGTFNNDFSNRLHLKPTVIV